MHNIFRMEILYYCVSAPIDGYCRMNIYVPPPHSCVEILLLNVMVFGDGIIGRCLGHWGGALMNEIIKETAES